MNLSLEWVDRLSQSGFEAVHWSSVGSPTAKDSEIMAYALQHQFIVLTHDLDFGAILAATQADAPSVLQIRTQETFVEMIGDLVISVMFQFIKELELGALISVDMQRSRIRILPIGRD